MNDPNKGYIGNIEDQTKNNEDYRRVLFTGPKSQLVVMSLEPGEDIGLEIHEGHDQFIRIEEGKARVTLGDKEIDVEEDFAVVVPSGTKHNVVNTSKTDRLKLYTIYSPPEHPKGTVQSNKPTE
jgi:mannose-6-phosphate isomerase-like protein (cupin superfamily)